MCEGVCACIAPSRCVFSPWSQLNSCPLCVPLFSQRRLAPILSVTVTLFLVEPFVSLSNPSQFLTPNTNPPNTGCTTITLSMTVSLFLVELFVSLSNPFQTLPPYTNSPDTGCTTPTLSVTVPLFLIEPFLSLSNPFQTLPPSTNPPITGCTTPTLSPSCCAQNASR